MLSRKAVLVEPGRFEIEEVDITCNAEQVLIKVEVCGLCNYELNHWKGILGELPTGLGHEVCGTVVSAGENVTKFTAGDVVTGICYNGFADYAVAKEANLYKINKDINPLHAFSEPLKCVITVTDAAQLRPGDVGIVLGCGPMGIWCVQALAGKKLGKLIAVDIEASKLELAKKYGAADVINAKAENLEEAVNRLTDGKMADFLIEGTGNPNTLCNLAPVLKTGRPRLVVMSAYENPSPPIDFSLYARKGTEFIFAMPRYSPDEPDDWKRAAEFINNGTFKMDGMISHVFELAQINEAFRTLESKPDGFIKGIVVPRN